MTARPIALWTDVTLVDEARALLADAGVTMLDSSPGEADAIIAGSGFAGTAAAFANAARLRVVARLGIGFDNIDVAAATRAGICVVNTPDAPTESTAEFAIALMLAVARQIVRGATELAAQRWNREPGLVGFDLAGKTLGLVGCGRIGARVAEVACALKMRVQTFDPGRPALPSGVHRVDSLSRLLRTSDVVSLHVPLSSTTRHLIGPKELALMPAHATLINTARGPLVDARALREALDAGRLAGAAIDVWDVEPPADDDPLVRHPRVLATPHMAAFTHEGRRRSHTAATTQCLQLLRGEQPTGLVNPEVWGHRRTQG